MSQLINKATKKSSLFRAVCVSLIFITLSHTMKSMVASSIFHLCTTWTYIVKHIEWPQGHHLGITLLVSSVGVADIYLISIYTNLSQIPISDSDLWENMTPSYELPFTSHHYISLFLILNLHNSQWHHISTSLQQWPSLEIKSMLKESLTKNIALQ